MTRRTAKRPVCPGALGVFRYTLVRAAVGLYARHPAAHSAFRGPWADPAGPGGAEYAGTFPARTGPTQGFMPVLMRAAGVFAVVQMQRLQPVKADGPAVDRPTPSRSFTMSYPASDTWHVSRRAQSSSPHRQASSRAAPRTGRRPRFPCRTSFQQRSCAAPAGRPHPDTPAISSIRLQRPVRHGCRDGIVEVSGRQLHALQIAFKDLRANSRVRSSLEHGFSVYGAWAAAAQLPVLLHLHKHTAASAGSALYSAPPRGLRMKRKGVRADGKRGPPPIAA